jgi:hypothetical protein
MRITAPIAVLLLVMPYFSTGQQQQGSSPTPPPPSAAQQPQFNEWNATFEGDSLNGEQWEKYSFEGEPGVSVKVEKGELRLHGQNNSRTGVRTKITFSGDRFIVDAKLARVGRRMPTADSPDDTGFAIVAVLFGGSELNRIEWILRSDGRLEAWLMRAHEPSQQLDDHKLGVKLTSPTLGLARRGDDFIFLVDGQVGMQKNIPGMPKDFNVMLYGFGSSENDWQSVRVVTPK